MQDLKSLTKEIRVSIIEMLARSASGHPGGSLSTVEILTALWFSEMRGVDPKNPGAERDRFVLSKGHGVPALYAILAHRGFLPKDELLTLRRTGSRLQGHPDRIRMPILEASTGSLGQGFSVAQGIALGLKMSGKKHRVFVVLGDGESQEGQIWETAMSAPKFKLSNLCAILDYNGGQIDGFVKDVMPLEPLADKWRAFGWEVMEINGNDLDEVLQALKRARELEEKGSEKPVYIIAHTIKGKGVSFMENKIEWHGVAPKPDEAKKAIEEIRRG